MILKPGFHRTLGRWTLLRREGFKGFRRFRGFKGEGGRFAADFEKGARLTAQVGAARGGGLCRRVVFADAQGLEVKRFLRLTGLRPEGP